MDQEVAKTLGELEIKLQELERELTSIGKRDAQPGKSQAQSKLIDEAVEGDNAAAANSEQPSTGTDNSWQHTSIETAQQQTNSSSTTRAGRARAWTTSKRGLWTTRLAGRRSLAARKFPRRVPPSSATRPFR